MKKLFSLTIFFTFSSISGMHQENYLDYMGRMLTSAMLNNNAEFAKSIISNNINLNINGEYGFTPLIAASYMNYFTIIKLLLTHNVSLNNFDEYGNTALIHSAEQGHEKIVELLIDADANLDIQNNNNETALIKIAKTQSSYKNKKTIFLMLIKAGANTELTDNTGKNFLDYIEDEELKKELIDLINYIKQNIKNTLLECISVKPICDIIQYYVM